MEIVSQQLFSILEPFFNKKMINLSRMENVFSINLRKYLERTGKDQTDIAAILDVSPGFISKMLNGRQEWKQGQMEAICREIGVPLWEMLKPESEAEISHVTPQDEWNFEKRKVWAKQIVPKYPSFNPTTDAFFKVYLEGNPGEVRAMETMIQSLAGQRAGPPEEERRGRPKKGKDVK